MLLALARALPALGCGSIIGVFRDARSHNGELEKRAAQAGLQVETVPCGGRWDWKAAGRVRDLIKAHSVDILHTHGYKADVYGYSAAWPNRVALVATCHNWPSRLPSMRAYAAIDRIALRGFDRVATASGPVAEVLSRWKVPSHKLRTIPNGVDMQPYRETSSELGAWSSIPEKLVGFAGRLVPDKGGALLLAAARTVLETYPNAKFVFAGEGPARAEWEALATKLGIGTRVVFAGRRDDMAAFYKSLDLLVLPSYKEAMPMCLLEAMAAAKAVIATAVGAIPQLIVPGVTGLLFEPGDAGALSAAILRLLRDPELGRALGQHGRAHVTRHFSAEVVAQTYLGLYQEALHEHCRHLDIPVALERSRS